MLLTPELLETAIPGCDGSRWAEPANTAAERWNCTAPMELVFVLASAAHETQGLTKMEESFNYSAQRLAEVWPKRFGGAHPGIQIGKGKVQSLWRPNQRAIDLAKAGPQAIANEVYANRMGNGGPETGDGWRYRGRGWCMLTGKDNYLRYESQEMRQKITDPNWSDELASDPVCSADAGFWHFVHRNGKFLADIPHANNAEAMAIAEHHFKLDEVRLNGTNPPINWHDRLKRFRQVLGAFREGGYL